MRGMTTADRLALINAIALREGTARQLSKRFNLPVADLRDFLEANRAAIEQASSAHLYSASEPENGAMPTPKQLDDLWLTNKFERLKRIQFLADGMYDSIVSGAYYGDATLMREYRSYLMLAANELGQLLHRGAGDSGGDTLSVDIQGIDMENLR